MSIKAAVHYSPGGKPGKSACGLPGVPPEGLTADLDAVTCGNCLSGLRWRNDISQRLYKGDYERFYGPGGFLDRAGQTTPASSTTAPQARAALEREARRELERVAGFARNGAGSDVLAVAVRNSADSLMRAADALLRVALSEAATAPAAGPSVTFDLADADNRHVLTQALEDYADSARANAAREDASESFTRWADLADQMREKTEEASRG